MKEPEDKKVAAEEKPVKTAPKKKLLRGVVANLPERCKTLNVRANPSLAANVVCIINVGDGVIIDPDKSEGNFYHVKTKAGETGFCMKKYIKVP